MIRLRLALFLLLAAFLGLSGCATRFPTSAETPARPAADGLDAATLFARALAAHGGDLHNSVSDLNLSTDGE